MAESLTEGCQLTGLIELDITQGALAGLPEEGITCVLGAAVEGLRGGGADSVAAAVGELDKLCECVRPAGPADERRVTDLCRGRET